MSGPLWRWHELCEALDLPPQAGPDVRGVSIDSRTIGDGELFIALSGDPGPRFNTGSRSDRDGHDFISAALERGAAGVLTHDPPARSCPELKVADTLDGLWALGRAARARLRSPAIAITGSSGKTTTKTMLAAALGAFSTPGSLNNHLGVPLSLARTPRDASAAVYELGTNHPGEIAPLSLLARPDVAVVLNVHPAHAEYFRDLTELRSEKLSIYKGLETKGVLVVEDLIDLGELPPDLQTLRFGRSADASVQLLEVSAGAASYRLADRQVSACVPGGGEHRAMSLAAVLGVFTALGIDPGPALTLDDALVPQGRGNRLQVSGVTIIDDSYNANPASMAAALVALGQVDGRKVAVLGEMLELGEAADEHHRGLAALCSDIDRVFTVGAGIEVLDETLGASLGGHFQEPGQVLLEILLAELQPGDTVLVKGSNRVFWSRGFVNQLTDHLADA